MILLTGATGFVGRNLLLGFLQQGREVAVSVRSPEKLTAQLKAEGLPENPPGLTVLGPHPAQWPSLRPTQAILGAGVLFARNREEYFTTNVDGTLSVLESLPADCRTVVLSSLAAGGPTPRGRVMRSESDPDQPITWYGESKLALEHEIQSRFADRGISVLRPPMVLGPRDSATLPLFRMARAWIRTKPGLSPKTYSFIDVGDLSDAINATLQAEPFSGPAYPAAPRPVSDWELIAAAASICRARGITVPVPHLAIRLLAAMVDALPPLRRQIPSLTRDRARDIWASRWVVDGSGFNRLVHWHPRVGLRESLRSTAEYYQKEGKL